MHTKQSPVDQSIEDSYFALAIVAIFIVGGLLWQGIARTNDELDQRAVISFVIWDTDARAISREKQELDAVGADIQEELDAIQKEFDAQ